MKWKADSKPKEGDVRVRTKFAWLPIHYYIDTEMWYCWLETYQVTEIYRKTYPTRECVWQLIERKPLYWEHEV
jgi:hypothetical protein